MNSQSHNLNVLYTQITRWIDHPDTHPETRKLLSRMRRLLSNGVDDYEDIITQLQAVDTIGWLPDDFDSEDE